MNVEKNQSHDDLWGIERRKVNNEVEGEKEDHGNNFLQKSEEEGEKDDKGEFFLKLSSEVEVEGKINLSGVDDTEVKFKSPRSPRDSSTKPKKHRDPHGKNPTSPRSPRDSSTKPKKYRELSHGKPPTSPRPEDPPKTPTSPKLDEHPTKSPTSPKLENRKTPTLPILEYPKTPTSTKLESPRSPRSPRGSGKRTNKSGPSSPRSVSVEEGNVELDIDNNEEELKIQEKLSKYKLLRKQREQELAQLEQVIKDVKNEIEEEKTKLSTELVKVNKKLKLESEAQEKDENLLKDAKLKKDLEDCKILKQRIRTRRIVYANLVQKLIKIEYDLQNIVSLRNQRKLEKFQCDLEKHTKLMEKEKERYQKLQEKQQQHEKQKKLLSLVSPHKTGSEEGLAVGDEGSSLDTSGVILAQAVNHPEFAEKLKHKKELSQDHKDLYINFDTVKSHNKGQEKTVAQNEKKTPRKKSNAKSSPAITPLQSPRDKHSSTLPSLPPLSGPTPPPLPSLPSPTQIPKWTKKSPKSTPHSPHKSFSEIPQILVSDPKEPINRTFILLVQWHDGNVKIEITTNSLDKLTSKVATKLKLNSPFRLEYYDSSFNEYAELNNLNDLEERAKLRAVVLPRQGWQLSAKFLNLNTWETHGGTTTPYKSIVLMEDSMVADPHEYSRLREMLKKYGVDKIGLKKVYAFQNDALENGFLFYTHSLMEKFRSSPNLFKKSGWKTEPQSETRQWVHHHYTNLTKKFADWSDSTEVPIIPVFQGTGKDTPWKIVQTGFSTVATLDEGWYGRGIYFTTSLSYASMYSKMATKGAPLTYVMLAFVSPGNAYPVIEDPTATGTLKGKEGVINPGYQSHYVLVNPPGGKKPGWPAEKGTKEVVDELVLFQDAQALPKYLLVLE